MKAKVNEIKLRATYLSCVQKVSGPQLFSAQFMLDKMLGDKFSALPKNSWGGLLLNGNYGF